MNKQQFLYVLQSALLHFDGVDLLGLMDASIPPKYARKGIELCEQLKQMEI